MRFFVNRIIENFYVNNKMKGRNRKRVGWHKMELEESKYLKSFPVTN